MCSSFSIDSTYTRLHAKVHLKIYSIHCSSRWLNFSQPPCGAKTYFDSIYANIYNKRSVLKNVSHEKIFQEIFIMARFYTELWKGERILTIKIQNLHQHQYHHRKYIAEARDLLKTWNCQMVFRSSLTLKTGSIHTRTGQNKLKYLL